MPKKHYRFYMDETDLGGFPFQNLAPREDGLNCFCYAGVLIAESDIEPTRRAYKAFCAKWGIDYPLHYNAIRMKTGKFAWLGKDKHLTNRDGEAFIKDYHEFMTEQPYMVFGCAVDKVSYESLFSIRDKSLLKKIKYAALSNTIHNLIDELTSKNVTVSLYFEEVGIKEDKAFYRCISAFMEATEVQNILIHETIGVLKDNEFTQIADFCAYPLAKSLYDRDYRPMLLLAEKDKLGGISYAT